MICAELRYDRINLLQGLAFHKAILNNKLLKNEFLFVWRITDSNRWPPACKAGALASWANPPERFLSSLEQIWTADPYIISVVL